MTPAYKMSICPVVVLTEAFALQCDPEEKDSCDAGCNGGLMNSAFEYTLKAGGLMREADYPYTGTDRGACKFEKTKIAAKVANFSVVSLNEDQIAANLVKNGPLAGICSLHLNSYLNNSSVTFFTSSLAFMKREINILVWLATHMHQILVC